MSNYSEVGTEFKDATLLVAALQAQGLKVEIHASPVKMRYTSRLADITVPIQGKAFEPLGFAKDAVSGTFGALVASEDKRAVYNSAFMARVKHSYAKAGVMQKATVAGLRYLGEKTVNGKLQMQFQKA